MTRTKIIILLAVFTLITFGNSLNNEFIGDAKSIFDINTFYKKPQNLIRLFRKDFITDSAQTLDLPGHEASFSGCISYRPVTALTFFGDYFLWRDRAFGHHLTNVLLHLLTCLAAYFLLDII